MKNLFLFNVKDETAGKYFWLFGGFEVPWMTALDGAFAWLGLASGTGF